MISKLGCPAIETDMRGEGSGQIEVGQREWVNLVCVKGSPVVKPSPGRFSLTNSELDVNISV